MIGRKTPWTPKDKHESGKYKKSLVHNEKNPYVIKSINNSTLYNEDCLVRKPPVILVAEGITDAIAAMERGFNAISPVTVRFKKADIDRLSRKLTGYSGKIIIIPDNEISKVGLDGALNTARTLSEQGLDARIAELPLEEIHVSARKALQQKYGIDLNKSSSEIANQIKKFTEDRDLRRIGELKKLSKIDINDYFKKGHSKEEFEKIFNDARTPLELSIAAIDPESDILDINEALNQIMAEINILGPVHQEHYLKEINKKLPNTTLAALRKTAAKVKDDDREPSQTEQNSLNKLLGLFYESDCSVFIDHLGNGWITARINNHYENIPIESKKFERMMLKKYHTTYKSGVESETINKMGMLLIEGATETRELFNGFAWLGDRVLRDMGDKDWNAIEVSAEGWRIIQPEKPVFRRFSHQLPMSIPQKGGDIRLILKYLAIKDEKNIALLLVWLCTCMFEHIGRPIIILHGIQGSCKTSAADFLRIIVDPSSVLHSALSKDHSEFVQFVDHHAVVSLDNLSGLPTWACDDLCQAVTGGGLSKRSLYTNDDDFTYRFRRVFILNGISVPTAAPDLLDRSILIELNRLEKKDRKKETKLKKEFEEDLPFILGHLLDVMVAVISRRNEEFNEYTRLADWFGLARIAAEELGVLDDFLNAFTRNEKEQHIEVVESHIESQILMQFLEGKESWDGTPTEFYENLTDIAEEQKLKRNWPKSPGSLVKKLKKLSHNLQEMGINFKSSSLGKSRRISITIMKMSESDETLSLSQPLTNYPRYPVSDVNPNEQETTTPMNPLSEEVKQWNECLQELFCTRSGSYMDDGMSVEESDLFAMEDVKNSPEYLIYLKTLGVDC
jgi:hypothetical protein